MKLLNSEGIIFRTIKYSETSIICDIYTEDKGLRSFIVSGVRSSRSGSKAAIYQPLNIVRIIAYDADGDKLSRIKEISLAYPYEAINVDVVISSMAIFMLEVARMSIKESEANPGLYQFLVASFKYTDQKKIKNPCLHLLFMIELSSYLGFGPLDNYSDETPYFNLTDGIYADTTTVKNDILGMDDSKDFYDLSRYTFGDIDQISLTKNRRGALLKHLLHFYKIHITGFRDPNSLEVMKSIFMS
ncbi:MAG: DNA repair protein RecO [Saprospiraceae bacterium]